MQEGLGDIVVVKRGVNRIAREHARQRQIAAGEPFGQTDEIGQDFGLLVGKHGTGAPETGHDFIDDEVHVVFVAKRTRGAQVIRVVHAHACGTLHQRLDDESGDFVMLFGQ